MSIDPPSTELERWMRENPYPGAEQTTAIIAGIRRINDVAEAHCMDDRVTRVEAIRTAVRLAVRNIEKAKVLDDAAAAARSDPEDFDGSV